MRRTAMAVLMRMQWDGVTPEQYEQAKQVVKWESEPAPGGLYHVSAFSEGRVYVVDVWESAEAFQTFVETRLMPGVQQVGIQGQPQVEILPVHDIFAPGYTAK
jgi:hypothetical protein